VTVAPGKSAPWSARKTFSVPSPLTCVLRGVS
jgi:hypothetical protein